MYRTLENLIKDISKKLERRGIYLKYKFDNGLNTVAGYIPSEHKIVLNPKEIESTLRGFSLSEFQTFHYMDRVVSHEIIHYLQTEMAKKLNNKGQSNLITNLFDTSKFNELYKSATEDANRGNYIITRENTFYARTTRLEALKYFFGEFEASSFNFSYEIDRETFRKKNNLKYYKEKIDFDKLFSKDLYNKAKESYKLYRTVSYVLASELAREIGKELNIKLDGLCASYGLYFYFKKYRGIFAKEAYKKLKELLKDGIKRQKFFDRNILKFEEYKKDPKVSNALYETYKRVLYDAFYFFNEYVDYVKHSNPIFQEIFRPY